MTKWYAIPHENKVGSYREEVNYTDFPRGVYLAYGNCCLIDNLKSEEEARAAILEFPCEKIKEAPHD